KRLWSHCVVDRERSDLRPAQGRAMPDQRDGKRPDIGPGAHVGVERHRLARIRDDVERVHRRPAYRHLHLDAATRELVRTLTADLHRRRGWDRQLDLPPEALEACPQLVLAGGRMAFY